MRRVRYQVACSLDGFIAGPDDDFHWITPEPAFDFEALYAQFDTLLMGRRTWEIVRAAGESFRGKEVIVASRTLRAEDHPGIEVVGENLEERVRALRGEPGRDIWLYGGGELFAQFLSWGLVDTVEPAIIPILLGGGVPFLPAPAVRQRLTLVGHRAYPSGMVLLEYRVGGPDDGDPAPVGDSGNDKARAAAAIEELVERETRAWDTRDADLLLTLFHPDMVWPWPPHKDAHDPAEWVVPWGRYDAERWRSGWAELFATHDLVHNRRVIRRIEVSAEGDGGFAVVDVDTLWRDAAGNQQHWIGRACKIYTRVGPEWKMIAHTGLLEYPLTTDR
jgi:dihydrofolate reductase/ketosteroid isomerase-like protein